MDDMGRLASCICFYEGAEGRVQCHWDGDIAYIWSFVTRFANTYERGRRILLLKCILASSNSHDNQCEFAHTSHISLVT